ncbi:dentin sialophosphoprotein-like [Hyposmocoma kahamanoa]|uniref:dentin sialophosphoprotein-like n=1 Tax=Hyposmocoma kahamanoa TaxID=1477025 RepID=UPI000E6D5DE4|nr:dentin sialophosphoprotein-like [Hyposmocoma kahamanoa]
MSFRNYYNTSSYGRSRDAARSATSISTDRPTSVTAKYSSVTPSYKSSIPVLSPERSQDETHISPITNRFANYSKAEKSTSKYDKKDYNEKSNSKFDKKDYEKPTSKYDKLTTKYDKKDYDKSSSKFEKKDYIEKPFSKYDKKDYVDKSLLKYEKKDFNKLTIPSLTTNRSRDVSPVSTSSKYSLTRQSRHLSPDRRTNKTFKEKSRDPSPADREKDIPNKTDKSSGYNSLSNFKLYPRSSNYTRSASRESKPELTVNRYSIANRLSSNYLRSPPTINRTSVSPVNLNEIPREKLKSDNEQCISPVALTEESSGPQKESEHKVIGNDIEIVIENEDENETETFTVVTRHTSPTPPGSSAYVRARRADMAKTVEKTLTRPKKRSEMTDREIQTDRLDDSTRSSRFASTARSSISNWSVYTPSATNYTGYAGRFSTQYPSLREKSGGSYSDRSSRSHSTERILKDSDLNTHSENIQNNDTTGSANNISESDQGIISVYEDKDDETSEIIINVNLKFKKAKSPLTVTSAELVSPEITVSNSQLPPQVPKPEGTGKAKKVKTRKSSTDSSDSGSKKKTIKRRSKSVSSTDSDQGNEANEKNTESSPSPTKSATKNSSSNNLQNGNINLERSKSRETNSPESSITLSTQSSISEDDTVSKSKINDTSRTSADETSIPTDRSAKQASPVGNQKEGGTEEAKSFLIRALAPVTNLFKMRHQDSTDNKTWPENSTSESTGKDISNLVTESEKSNKNKNTTNNIIASNEDNIVKLKAIRHIESGERAWWLDSQSDKLNSQSTNKSPSEKNIPKKIRHIESGERAWWLESNGSENTTENSCQQNSSENVGKQFKKCKFVEDEKPWWLDSSANIPEGVEQLTPPRKSSSDSDKSEKFNFYKIRHIESGEQKDWWLSSNDNSLNSNKLEGQNTQNSLSKSGSDQRGFPLRRIRHVESGERPWWLASDKNIPEGIEKLPTPPPQQDSDSSDYEEVQEGVLKA